ncbi:hypothetical protein Pyn_15968 [Prunus yedoensis var. nudiflora]|uniref:PB1 domain-containing protein n=1 Tax=Prunus yedoensis var. nudiflora TaxID=2094558 RepID=A0A314XTA7_PRUYE|nr:hypothetical protein Pyn_15968 [Prunus yedoensis var. nudiflora]
MDQHKTDDNLRYVGGLTRVLVAADASISFAELMVKLAKFCGYSVDLRCQLLDEGVQNADAGGDCKKNEDEDDFSFTCTNLDGSPISTDDIFQNGQIRPVFPISTRISYSSMPTTTILLEPEGCRFIFLSAAAIEEALL